MSAPGKEGYPALLGSPRCRALLRHGHGVLQPIHQGLDILAANAFEVPVTPGVRLHNLLTVFLDPVNGEGGIRNVVNGVGGPSSIANASTPVTVTDSREAPPTRYAVGRGASRTHRRGSA